MDMKKIGGFLKKLRKERGMTQEQLAEIFLVSGRTVSRWETGTTMPDLSILIQIAEFYDVEVKEILEGERIGEKMDQELKDTLSKVADYHKLEKQKAAKAGNLAFILTVAVCAAAIIIQLILTGKWIMVAGETAVLVIGGVVYIGVMTYQGIYETGTKIKNTPFTDAIISILCAAAATAALAIYYIRWGAEISQTIRISCLFFAGIGVCGFAVLRMLAHVSHKRQEKTK